MGRWTLAIVQHNRSTNSQPSKATRVAHRQETGAFLGEQDQLGTKQAGAVVHWQLCNATGHQIHNLARSPESCRDKRLVHSPVNKTNWAPEQAGAVVHWQMCNAIGYQIHNVVRSPESCRDRRLMHSPVNKTNWAPRQAGAVGHWQMPDTTGHQIHNLMRSPESHMDKRLVYSPVNKTNCVYPSKRRVAEQLPMFNITSQQSHARTRMLVNKEGT